MECKQYLGRVKKIAFITATIRECNQTVSLTVCKSVPRQFLDTNVSHTHVPRLTQQKKQGLESYSTLIEEKKNGRKKREKLEVKNVFDGRAKNLWPEVFPYSLLLFFLFAVFAVHSTVLLLPLRPHNASGQLSN